jgi:hypothetical protein
MARKSVEGQKGSKPMPVGYYQSMRIFHRGAPICASFPVTVGALLQDNEPAP